MKYLVFNAVVLAALGYLFAADGRLEFPEMAEDAPVTAVAPVRTATPEPTSEPFPEPEADAASDTIAPAPVDATPAPEPAQDASVFTPPPEAPPVPELPEAVPVEPLSETQIATAPPADRPEIRLEDGEALMSRSERTRELDKLIEDMELFYIERTTR